MRWKLGPPERVASYRVFSVARSTVSGPRADHPPVYTIECADWCNVVAITRDELLVLVRQLRFGTREKTLELPGGMIGAGENPAKAALRELREETGYVGARAEPLVVVHPNPALQNNRHFAFLARGVEKKFAAALDEHEDCETVLVPLRDAEKILSDGRMMHALCHAALSAFLRHAGDRPSHMSKSALRKKKRPSVTPSASASRRKS